MQPATLDNFRNAILASTGLNVPNAGASPNMGGAGTANADTAIQHLQGLARSSFQLPAASTGAGALGAQAGVQDAQEKADAKQRLQDIQDQLDQAVQTRKDMADPSKYKRVENKSGGWDFYAPDGSKITAQDYAYVSGKHVTDVLKGSQNTKDQQFLQDYNDVVKLGQIMQNGDKAALDKLYKSDPSLKDRIGKMSYADIVKNFRQSYPEYFPADYTQNVGDAGYAKKSPASLGAGQNFMQKLIGFFTGA